MLGRGWLSLTRALLQRCFVSARAITSLLGCFINDASPELSVVGSHHPPYYTINCNTHTWVLQGLRATPRNFLSKSALSSISCFFFFLKKRNGIIYVVKHFSLFACHISWFTWWYVITFPEFYLVVRRKCWTLFFLMICFSRFDNDDPKAQPGLL